MSYFDDYIEPYLMGEDFICEDGSPLPTDVIGNLLGWIDPIDGSELTTKKINKQLGRIDKCKAM